MPSPWRPPLPEMPAPPPERAWARLSAPEGYATQWRRLVDAALELGYGPDDISAGALDDIAAAREWKPATVTLYSKVARYGGLDVATPATPEPDPAVLELRPLAEVRGDDPEHLRTVAWCAIALDWPAPIGSFQALRREQVRTTPRQLVVSTDDGEWSVTGALRAWHAWEEVRNRFPSLAASPWVLPALRRGPGPRSCIGGQLSSQALQVTFTKHARRTAGHLRATAPPARRKAVEALATVYSTLSFDSYRRLALAGGAAPVAERGAVRATRVAGKAPGNRAPSPART